MAQDRLTVLTRRPLPVESGPEAFWIMASHALLSEILVSGGRISSALEHSGAALGLIERLGGMLHGYCGFVVVRHAHALLHGGRFAELERLLAAKLQDRKSVV